MPTVHRADPSHLDALADLFDAYRRFYGRPGDVPGARAFLAERLDRGDSVVFIAEDGGAPAGFTQLYPSFTSVGMGRLWVLNDLFVAETARGRGVGRALLGAARGFAEETGAVRLTLQTAVDNRTAQALYESVGWTRDDDFHTYTLSLGAR